MALLEPRTLAPLVLFSIACTVVIDRDRFEDGGDAGGRPSSTTGPTTTGATTDVGSTTSSAGGGPPVGSCVNEQFHVSFDEPTSDGWLDQVLRIRRAGATSGVLTDELPRRGAGAWRIDLAEEDQFAVLRTVTNMQENADYWIGFSTKHEGPATAAGTRLLRLMCYLNGENNVWERSVLNLEMLKGMPGQPYMLFGIAPDLKGPKETREPLPVAGGTDWGDWAVHVRFSRGEDGLVEIWHAGTQVYTVSGVLVPPACIPMAGGNEQPTSFGAEFGLYRWEGFGDGGADAAPNPQSLVQDEITLLRQTDGAFTEADALHTLAPDSGCFDRRR